MTAPTRTVNSYCRICEALCGILVDVADDEIVNVRGDPDHVSSRGYLCPKGAAMAKVVNDPDRVLFHPMSASRRHVRRVRWDDSARQIAERLQAVMARTVGARSACYSGNPLGYGPASHMWGKKLPGRNRHTARLQRGDARTRPRGTQRTTTSSATRWHCRFRTSHTRPSCCALGPTRSSVRAHW